MYDNIIIFIPLHGVDDKQVMWVFLCFLRGFFSSVNGGGCRNFELGAQHISDHIARSFSTVPLV